MRAFINHRQWRLLGPLAILIALQTAHAQQNPAVAGYVYPAGGQQGTTVKVTVGGQFLQGVKSATISGPGVRVTVLDYSRPINQMQADELRDKLRELRDRRQAYLGRPARPAPPQRATATSRATASQPASASQPTSASKPAVASQPTSTSRAASTSQASTTSQPASAPTWTDKDEEQFRDIANTLGIFARRRAVPALSETVTLEIAIAPDAQPGPRQLRLQVANGLTSPLAFYVSSLPEISQKLSQGAEAFGISDDPNFGQGNRFLPPREDTTLTLPTTVNGQIAPGIVDHYRFAAKKGQRIVVAVQARELIPYMPDAVPGWFQALITVRDDHGNELACADHFRFHPDPVLCLQIPKDGTYMLDIRDALYRGREDFVYRISIGELPYVTDVYPLGASAGGKTSLRLYGWNLSATSLAVDCKDKSPGLTFLPPGGPGVFPARVPLSIDALPEVFDSPGNIDPAHAQNVTLPVIINGRIDVKGRPDVYAFQGHAGDKIVAEVYARRLDSPLDSVIKLTDAAGKQLAYNDDVEDKSAGLLTHQADSFFIATLPADGKYFVHIADIQGKAGPEFAYRLRLSPPQPDFDLRITPASLTIRGAQSLPMTVYAIRKDGYDGPIDLSLQNSPAGFALAGARIPAGQDQIRVTLTAPRQSPWNAPVNMTVVGSATIEGLQITHQALPATDMMQAFAYRHLVPADDLKVATLGNPMPVGVPRLLSASPVKFVPGGKAAIEFAMPGAGSLDNFQCDLSDAPDGFKVQKVSATNRGVEVVISYNPAKPQPPFEGNLILSVSAMRAPSAQPAPAPTSRPTTSQATTQASRPTTSQAATQASQPATSQPATRASQPTTNQPPNQANRRNRFPLGTLPAIPFQVLPNR